MKLNRARLLGTAPSVWYLFFLCVPLLLIFLISFVKRGTYGGIEWQWSIANFQRIFDPLYWRVFRSSVLLAAFNASFCVLIAVPVAYTIVTIKSVWRGLVLFTVCLPSLTCLLVRINAIRVLFGFDGVILKFLRIFNSDFDPFILTDNWFLVMFGMLVTYLPFAILPIYSALERFDFSLLEAACDLGASFHKAFLRVLLPWLGTSLRRTWWLVFVPSLGEFVIPDLLGGARSQLIGNVITEQFLRARDWPMGAALTVVFVGLIVLVGRLLKVEDK